MIEERIYTISLQKVKEKAPRTKRAKKAINYIRAFLEKHVKDEVFISPSLNEKIWERGVQKIPARVRVKVMKDEEGKLIAELAE